MTNEPSDQREFTVIPENSSSSFVFETNLSLNECVGRIHEIASPRSGVQEWDSIKTQIQQIDENEYRFYISFRAKRYRQWTATTEAEANGILRSISDHKTFIQVEANKIDGRSGKILFVLMLGVIVLTLLRYLSGSSVADLAGFIIAIIALFIIFLFWIDKATYSYRMQRLIFNLFKEK